MGLAKTLELFVDCEISISQNAICSLTDHLGVTDNSSKLIQQALTLQKC